MDRMHPEDKRDIVRAMVAVYEGLDRNETRADFILEHLGLGPSTFKENARIKELEAEAVLRKRDHDKDRADRNLCRTWIGNIAAEVGGDARDLVGLYSLLKAKIDIRRP